VSAPTHIHRPRDRKWSQREVTKQSQERSVVGRNTPVTLPKPPWVAKTETNAQET